MKDSITQFQSLLKSLTAEKATLTARLKAIDAVLSSVPGTAAPAAVSGKRSFSAATKAKMAAAQQARWAKKKGPKAAPTNAPGTASESTNLASTSGLGFQRNFAAGGQLLVDFANSFLLEYTGGGPVTMRPLHCAGPVFVPV